MADKPTPDFLDKILNDAEKTALETFVKNAVTLSAVKKVLLSSVYYNGTLEAGKEPDPTRNGALSLALDQTKEYTDEHLGRDVRAYATGVRLIEMGFGKLVDKFGLDKAGGTGSTPNRAR